ncbi:hypothetical protein CJF42_09965 [Pseudoalteromonas sp. NBT06-2]|uniref:hypothetical protein n=1 Tax=Pseudoalteromonas sp. NBT06-2 TaxID=2025950 RepID=UPI000BA623D9|nr:hypothetical protein [Pseudoalteromonas sp. NBT06-2]PAJ74538.1 hypothetical protein CJF42_09965 [Pseudoalteromonas sp. NBT06-2]
MINLNEFSFNGQITNRNNVTSQLKLPENVSDFELIQSAYLKWQLALNLYLAGDYVIVLPLEKNQQVFLCLSAFSSHQLFYKNDATTLSISKTLSDFSHQAKVDPFAVSQLLHWRNICSPNTLFKDVFALNNGQSAIWQHESNPELISQKQLTLSQKLNAAQSETPEHKVGNITNNELSFFNIFNQLPQLSQLMTQPVSALWQIEFLLLVQISHDHQLICDHKPQLELVQNKSKNSFNHNIFRRRLNTQNSPLTKLKKYLFKQYKLEIASGAFESTPNFEVWMYLTFELPNKWAQQRLIAQTYNKDIQFNYCDSNKLKQLLIEQSNPTKTTQPHSQFFSFNDESIVNIFDAMQRLMHHGFDPVTNKLFHIVPPISAKLLKKHNKNPTQVEEFCCLSLTLDHLARHANWSVD